MKKRVFTVHQYMSTGTAYLFWEEIDEYEDWHLFYRSKQSNGILSPVIQIGSKPLPFVESQISVQSTDNSMHILLMADTAEFLIKDVRIGMMLLV
jgi:hypothetical protein